ncbi:right-handed parallel beta-helix repeat-containing protein [Halobacteria archaeon AArc-m2/3/4]|uniref:Right-handed parallel beta-helix repeat-containing protein n=1 Tax=Natronoglomus mannanivorans TaxID=2979990 RepID=A0ABT2QGZ8_9EURY|nr:right-handed parallel beta-helix repeat-containing protein [Halobacteria archaeon AArc-m2/3/4]
MAREPSVRNDDAVGSEDGSSSGAQTGNDGLLNRRSYLKMAGAATAGAAATAATGTAAASEYDVIKVSAGQRRVIRVGSGETFANKLIDVTANRAKVIIAAHGTNWTIRNVGIKGYVNDGSPDTMFGLSDRSGNTSTVENVYLGDGAADGSSATSMTGVWVAPQHSGHIDFKNVHVAGMPDNGFYASAPGSSGSGGTVRFEECYAYNNGISQYRLGDGSEVVDSVACVDNNNRHHNGRGVWAWGTNRVEVHGSNIDNGGGGPAVVCGAHSGGPTVHAYDSHFRGSIHRTNGGSFRHHSGSRNPDSTPPKGVPMSAEEAAAGDGDYEAKPTYEYAMRFQGEGAYFFRTEGGSVEGTDEDDCIEGLVDGESVEIGYDTYLANVGVTDGVEARILVNGNSYEPTWSKYDGPEAEEWLESELWNDDESEDEEKAEEEQLENVILIEGSPDGVTRYEFVTSGDVEKSNYKGASLDDEDVIEDDHVHGVVATWRDAFRFDGDLEELTVDGPGTVYVNDEEVDPDSVGQKLPHVLEIEGQGTPSSFNITVDGTIEYDGDNGADDVTIISGTTVESSITDSTQTFRFSGALTDITFTDGEAVVTLDGEKVDLSEYGDQDLLPHAIVIDGTEADEPSTYSFTVDGKVVKSDYMGASIDDEDVIEGEAVRGGVANWLDAFWFKGNITDFKLVGDAKTHVEYNAREQ